MRTSRKIAVAFVALLGSAPRLYAQSCRAADSTSTFMLNAVKNMMTSSDSHIASERQTLHLPLIAADSVALVADESVCSRMATAYSAVLPANKTPSGKVYVVQVGAVYVVRDPAIVTGEYVTEMVINDQGVVLARYGS